MAEDQLFKQIKGSGKDGDFGSGCGVTEVTFPCLGKCCSKYSSLSGDVYKVICPHCSIWTSLPDGANLVITHIFECLLYGYGKRIKE